MHKLTDLRQHLINRIPELQRSPERLLLFIENGKIIVHEGNNYSHQYKMPVRVVVTDWRHSADEIVVPLLEWLLVREPGFNPETVITFDAEILNHESVDLALTAHITERVIVRDNCATGERVITHVLPPPTPTMNCDASLKIVVQGPAGGFTVPQEE